MGADFSAQMKGQRLLHENCKTGNYNELHVEKNDNHVPA
jgi:hypothetical protein